MASFSQPIVMDGGSGVFRAGFAGAERPSCIFPTFIGRPKHRRVMLQSKLEGSYFVGRVAEDNRGLMSLTYPVKRGMVTNWADMERLWEFVYSARGLGTGVRAEDHPVLATEAPLNPWTNREKVAEAFFETFQAPALFISPQAALTLYASGRTTGVVLDSGEGVTHVVPMYEGFALPHATVRVDVAGCDVTARLVYLLRKSGCAMHTTAEVEAVRQLKEACCYVTADPVPGVSDAGRAGDADVTPRNRGRMQSRTAPKQDVRRVYHLPDGRALYLHDELFRAPEILFRPSLIGSEYHGAHRCLVESVFKTDMDLRRTLLAQVILAGGTTLFPGYGERLLHEARRELSARFASLGGIRNGHDSNNVKVRIAAPPNRKLLTWIGGSILASLATFKSMWVSRGEYEEHGAGVFYSKE